MRSNLRRCPFDKINAVEPLRAGSASSKGESVGAEAEGGDVGSGEDSYEAGVAEAPQAVANSTTVINNARNLSCHREYSWR